MSEGIKDAHSSAFNLMSNGVIMGIRSVVNGSSQSARKRVASLFPL